MAPATRGSVNGPIGDPLKHERALILDGLHYAARRIEATDPRSAQQLRYIAARAAADPSTLDEARQWLHAAEAVIR